MAEFDYVVVGAGSAGCVVASRLTEDPNVSVCLIEAGGKDTSTFIHVPAGLVALVPRRLCNWQFETVPQAGFGGRRGYQPRGKTLGGSSSINAMIYIRGHRSDYDHWAELGNSGWAWDDVLPYFKKAERNHTHSDEHHGTEGPLDVDEVRTGNTLSRAFVDAAEQAGYRRNLDFNGAEQEGCGLYQVTHRNGSRCSAAKAYLTDNLGRPNLHVITGADAERVVFEGRRAVGVQLRRADGTRETVTARAEVILSAGAFGSPQLLMLSGIGDQADLKQLGIDEVLHAPGVGRNLQDHIDFILGYRSDSRDAVSFSPLMLPVLWKAIQVYRRERRGFLTTNYAEAGGFVKSEPDLAVPDLQFHFVVGQVIDHGRKLTFSAGVSLHVCALRPQSRGTVRLESRDPRRAPLIDPQFLAERADVDLMIKGVRQARRIMAAPAMAGLHGPELRTGAAQTDAEIEAALRARCDTIYHPVGTCRMGRDTLAVVDPELRVRGVEGLRVVDASIMPTLIGGNTNAPSIMIGEKAVDLIRAGAKAGQGAERVLAAV